eukprot:CAMPEP_0202460936 /NCGR_PEP_ID=MMETSP1360-20130828/46689_1 /ASSEMBLY_ACC=CAM_ASM_000848 /TAXON_ID=515479 /ORGANISM="Licmophora paradoxa, Strain CCMP2313" /LENGTH=150 /DNA_ID=CAMNT_0049082799 /DNA_START=106 /DNA_END=558 /DNA_ORIENTATION=+
MATITLTPEGVAGDYNHYRTQALASTPDRAISILTTDAVKFVRTLYSNSQDGDLGENILIDGIHSRAIKVGERYRFGEIAVVQITEPIEPCANLCKLPYINDPTITQPRQRLERCKHFINKLDSYDGLRGWYAKVIQPGDVKVGDLLQLA